MSTPVARALRANPPLIALAAIGFVLLSPLQAQAAFQKVVSATLPVSTGTLAPPPATPTVSTSTCGIVIADTPKLTVSWPATPSTFATGYLVTPYIGTAAQTPTTVTGGTTTSVPIPVTRTVTYSFRVQATFLNWTSTTVTSATASCPVLGVI